MLGPDKIELLENIPDLLRNWAKLSPFCFSNKNLLKTAWMWIPKFTCWKLWLERNNRIFREESCNPVRITSKIKAMLGEALEAQLSIRNGMLLDIEEDQWLKELAPNHQNKPIPLAKAPAHWEIRLEEQEFIKWRSALDEHCLFFDGASKGNSGAAGGSGVFIGLGGSTKLRCLGSGA